MSTKYDLNGIVKAQNSIRNNAQVFLKLLPKWIKLDRSVSINDAPIQILRVINDRELFFKAFVETKSPIDYAQAFSMRNYLSRVIIH